MSFPDDPEPVERTRKLDDARAAEREAGSMVAEQLSEGFSEVSTPAWRQTLDDLVGWWNEDDPAFGAPALRDEFLQNESAEELMGAILQLRDRETVEPDPRTTQAVALLERRLPEALPALQLALRLPDAPAHRRLESLFAKTTPEAALPALYSVLEHPPENLDTSFGGRPVSLPAWVLGRYPAPDEERFARLVALLDAEDVRQVGAAHKILAEHSNDDRCFQALLERAHQDTDDVALAVVRAAEVRKDPRLRRALERFEKRKLGAGWRDRVRDALVGLRES